MELPCHLVCHDPSCCFLIYICTFRYLLYWRNFFNSSEGTWRASGGLIESHWSARWPALLLSIGLEYCDTSFDGGTCRVLGFWRFIFLLILFFSVIILLLDIIRGFIVIYCNLKSAVILLNNKSRLFSQKYSDALVAFELIWVPCPFTRVQVLVWKCVLDFFRPIRMMPSFGFCYIQSHKYFHIAF